MKHKIVCVDDEPVKASALIRGDVLKCISKPRDETTLIHEIHHAFDKLDSIKARTICRCDICDTKCMAETIQSHNSLHVCIQCKKRLEALPKEVIYNFARFANGKDRGKNVLSRDPYVL